MRKQIGRFELIFFFSLSLYLTIIIIRYQFLFTMMMMKKKKKQPPRNKLVTLVFIAESCTSIELLHSYHQRLLLFSFFFAFGMFFFLLLFSLTILLFQSGCYCCIYTAINNNKPHFRNLHWSSITTNDYHVGEKERDEEKGENISRNSV